MTDYLLNVAFSFAGYAWFPLIVFGFALHYSKDNKTLRGWALKFFGIVFFLLFLVSALNPSNTPKRESTVVERHAKAMDEQIKAETSEKLRQTAEKSLESALRPNDLTDAERQKRFEEITKIKKDQE